MPPILTPIHQAAPPTLGFSSPITHDSGNPTPTLGPFSVEYSALPTLDSVLFRSSEPIFGCAAALVLN